jgi:GNAT superfamily N-acetyltransferase
MTQKPLAVSIRQASPADWHRFSDVYSPASRDPLLQRVPAEVEEHERGWRLLYLAERDGNVVGTAGLVFKGRDAGAADGVTSANIHRLQTLEAERRRGVATTLLAAAEEEARRRASAASRSTSSATTRRPSPSTRSWASGRSGLVLARARSSTRRR